MNVRCWKNGASRLIRCRVAANLQSVKNTIPGSTTERSAMKGVMPMSLLCRHYHYHCLTNEEPMLRDSII